MGVRAVEHRFAVELELSLAPERWDRVAAWILPGGLMVDTGGARTGPELLQALRERGGLPDAVFIGHWHEDHSGAAARLGSAGVPLFGSRRTAARLRRPPGIPEYRALLWGQIEPVQVAPVPASGPVRPLPLPGHSPDQLGYLDERTGVLFSGDLALRRFQRVAMPGEDPHAMMQSIRDVLALGPHALATSHRGLLSDWRTYLEEQLDYLETTRDRVRRLHSDGRAVDEIVLELYGGEAPGPDGRAWRDFSRGEFSSARWVTSLLEGPGSAASARSSPAPRRPSAGSRPTSARG